MLIFANKFIFYLFIVLETSGLVPGHELNTRLEDPGHGHILRDRDPDHTLEGMFFFHSKIYSIVILSFYVWP